MVVYRGNNAWVWRLIEEAFVTHYRVQLTNKQRARLAVSANACNPSIARKSLYCDRGRSSLGVELFVDGAQVFMVDVGVDLGGADIGVAEHFLDAAQVSTSGKQVGAETVS